MFVLMSLMCSCLQRTTVLFVGLHRPSAPVKREQPAINSIAIQAPDPIAPVHAPTPRLIV